MFPNTVPPISDISWSTDGYDLGDQASITSTNYSSLLCGGATTLVPVTENVQTPQSVMGAYSTNQTVKDIRATVGNPTGVNGTGYVNLGPGQDYTVEQISNGVISNPLLSRADADILDRALTTYTGADVRLIIELQNPNAQGSAQSRYSKQLIECTTISVSIHREKAPVRALGYINPKGFVRGTRTIAGTMVLTQFTTEVLMHFLQRGAYTNDLSKDSTHLKVDQLPPFDITMLFSDEIGNVSYRRLLGVQFVTDGVVYSIQDMLSEQTISYMCEDFTPLLPLDVSSLLKSSSIWHPVTSRQRTPMDAISNYSRINPKVNI